MRLFYCTEPAYSSCLAPEEQWSEPEDSQEFVESPYVPGSIVWAKMDGYPWLVVARLVYTLLLHVMYGLPPHTWMHRWPAMMEEDPDREAYYEMGGHRNVPVWAVIIKLTLYTVHEEQKDVAACVMLPK